MSLILPSFIADDHLPGGPASTPFSTEPPSEADAFDAYSRVVMSVAERIRPAVANLRVGRGPNGGSGSGVLFTPDGFLLTNAHVVAGSENVRVRLNDREELGGRLVGS